MKRRPAAVGQMSSRQIPILRRCNTVPILCENVKSA
ncbi:MAG: hypothetical protein JWN02_1503 [Acidobacteria bacterium]|nr:hypothetical protein [Acidobacteriota bacterium]